MTEKIKKDIVEEAQDKNVVVKKVEVKTVQQGEKTWKKKSKKVKVSEIAKKFEVKKVQGVLSKKKEVKDEKKKEKVKVAEKKTTEEDSISIPKYKTEIVTRVLTTEVMSKLKIGKEELISLCKEAAKILTSQPNLVHVTAKKGKVLVVGDLHGEMKDLKHIFSARGYPDAKKDLKYVFLGDYVDRGANSIPVFTLIIGFVVEFGKKAVEKFVCLRGNHETRQLAEVYGCLEECKKEFGEKDGKEVFAAFCEVFTMFPIAAIVNKQVFCVHGGISQLMKNVDDLKKIERRNQDLLKGNAKVGCKLEIFFEDSEKMFIDMLWSDPDEKNNGYNISQRGAGHLYGKDVLYTFLKDNGLSKIVSSHRLVMEGIKFLFDDSCITVFSASNYCGLCMNRGGIAEIENGKVSPYTYLVDNSLRKRIVLFPAKVGDVKSKSKKEISILLDEADEMEKELEEDYQKMKFYLQSSKEELRGPKK